MPNFKNCNFGDTFEKVIKTENMSIRENEFGPMIWSPGELGDKSAQIVYEGTLLGKHAHFRYMFLDNKLTHIDVTVNPELKNPQLLIKDFLYIADCLTNNYGTPEAGNPDRPNHWETYLDEQKYNTGLVGWGKALENGLVNFYCEWNDTNVNVELSLLCDEGEFDCLGETCTYKDIILSVFYLGLDYEDLFDEYTSDNN